MAHYQYRREQIINAGIEEVWDFISSPLNLGRITPPSMNFEIKSLLPGKMYAGLIIIYRVSPLKFWRTTWVTEITHISEGKYFVDEQRSGPYHLWHHEHILEPAKNSTLMKDVVSYSPPLGIIGSIANKLFIKDQLKAVFDYRSAALNRIFPHTPTPHEESPKD